MIEFALPGCPECLWPEGHDPRCPASPMHALDESPATAGTWDDVPAPVE